MSEPIAIGAAAAPFALLDQHGATVSLAGLSGRRALLFFFPFAFTSVCAGELRGLRERQRGFAELGCEVLACSVDSMFTLRRFADDEKVEFSLLSDFWPHGGLARAYGAFDELRGCARRHSFLVDGGGRVAWRAAGDLPHSRDLDAHLDAARALA